MREPEGLGQPTSHDPLDYARPADWEPLPDGDEEAPPSPQQASLQPRGFPEGRSFYTQTTEIRRMSFIPPNAHLFTVCAGDHAAAHPAVRARCPGFGHEASARITSSSFPTHTLPFSIFTGQARTTGSPFST